MTRDEFEAFMEGEQWTPEQCASFKDFTPVCDPAALKSELARPDGIIPVRIEKGKSRLFGDIVRLSRRVLAA